MLSFAKSDFYLAQENGKLVVYDGTSRDLLLTNNKTGIDRTMVRGAILGETVPFRVNTELLKRHERKGLGVALYSLGRALTHKAGAEVRIVENDATARRDSRGSYYVNRLGARLEERKIPKATGLRKVPVFDTQETPEQPYKFGLVTSKIKVDIKI